MNFCQIVCRYKIVKRENVNINIHANRAYKLNICNIFLFCKYQQNKKEQK